MMKINQNLRRVTSFLTALGMSFSALSSSAGVVFADSGGKAVATIVNDSEHGELAFVANDNFEDVYVDVPISEADLLSYSFNLDDTGEVVAEEVTPESIDISSTLEVSTIESTSEETTEAIEVTEPETSEATENVETTESTEAVTEGETENATVETSEATETTEAVTETETSPETEAVVEATEQKIDAAPVEEVVEDSVEETEATVQYTKVLDPNSKLISYRTGVDVVVTPDAGYDVENIYVVTSEGKSVVYRYRDGVIHFNMAKNDVTIRATFTDIVNEVEPDDYIDDLATYIKSNLDSKFVTKNKWEPVDAIRVKYLTVDNKIMNDYNVPLTLDGFDTTENAQMALVNFMQSTVLVYDVDSNSNYYVAFVDLLKDDDEIVVNDYLWAKNNDNGEVLSDYYLDTNTGLVYLNKEKIRTSMINDTNENDYVIGQTQFQILGGYVSENYSHSINYVVTDNTNTISTTSGTINVDTYDIYTSIKLADNDKALQALRNAQIVVNLNGVTFEVTNDTDIVAYDASTGILYLYQPGSINTIDVIINESNKNISNKTNSNTVNAYGTLGNSWSSILNGDYINGANWKFESGNANPINYEFITNNRYWYTNNVLDSDIGWSYLLAVGSKNDGYVYQTPITDTSGYHTNGYYVTSGFNNQIKKILDGSLIGQASETDYTDEFGNSIRHNIAWAVPYGGLDNAQGTYRFYTKAKAQATFKSKSGDTTSTWTINDSNINMAYGVDCCHVGHKNEYTPFKNTDANKEREISAGEMHIRILHVIPEKNLIIWSAVYRPVWDGNDGGQGGVGVYVSKYELKQSFTLKKTFEGTNLDVIKNNPAYNPKANVNATDGNYSNNYHWGASFRVYDTNLKNSSGTDQQVFEIYFTNSNDMYLVYTAPSGYLPNVSSKEDYYNKYYPGKYVSGRGISLGIGTQIYCKNTTYNLVELAINNQNTNTSNYVYTDNKNNIITVNTNHVAPKNFDILSDIKFTVNAGQISVAVQDKNDQNNDVDPKNKPIMIKLDIEKLDDNGNALSGAEFKIYYSMTKIDLDQLVLSANDNNTGVTFGLKNSTNLVTSKLAKTDVVDPKKVYYIGSGKTGDDGKISSYTIENSFDLITKQNDFLYDCPLGYYYIVESKTPTNYKIELYNNKPVCYYIDATNTKHSSTRKTSAASRSVYEIDNSYTKILGYNNNTYNELEYSTVHNAYAHNTNVTAINTGKYQFKAYKSFDKTYDTGENSTDSSFYNFVNPSKYKNFHNIFLDTTNGLPNKITPYSLYGTTYILYTTQNGVNTEIATGIIDTDTVNETAIKWTINAAGKNAGYSVSSDQTVVNGFEAGTNVIVMESKTGKNNSNKVVGSLNHKLTITDDNTKNVLSGDSSIQNYIQVGRMSLTKNVILNEGQKVHTGTVLNAVLSDDRTIKHTITKDDVHNGVYEINPDDYATLFNSNSVNRVYLELNTVSNEDLIYFNGTTFEVWYNAMAINGSSSQEEYFPHIVTNDTLNNTQFLPIDPSDFNKRCAVKIADVEIVNGKLVYTTLPFKVNYITDDAKIIECGTEYEASLSNNEDALCDLPVGVYAVYETSCPEGVHIGDVVSYNMIEESSNYNATFAESNNTSVNKYVTINLFKGSNAKNKTNMDGAIYSIYYSPNTDNDIAVSDRGNVTVDPTTKEITYNVPKDFYKVGEMMIANSVSSKTSFDNGPNSSPTYSAVHGTENIGVVINNIFAYSSANNPVWFGDNRNIIGEIDKLPEDVRAAYIALTSNINPDSNLYYINDSYKYDAKARPQWEIYATTGGYGTNVVTTSYASLLNISNFNGPSGHYIIVETKTPDSGKFNTDTNIYYSHLKTNGAQSTAKINSTDKVAKDILSINLSKINDDGLQKFNSVDGTVFTLKYYSYFRPEIAEIYNNTKLSKTEIENNLALNKADNILEYQIIDGEIRFSDTRYLTSNNSQIIINRLLDESGRISFEDGFVVITETRSAEAYRISSTDEFKDDTYNYGHNLVAKLITINAGTRVGTYTHLITKDGQLIRQSNASTENSSLAINNKSGDPFNFTKMNEDARTLSNMWFKLTMYNADGTPYKYNGKTYEWTFSTDDNGVANSRKLSAFDDVDGRPLVPNAKYILEELPSTASTGKYLLKTPMFTYIPNETNLMKLLLGVENTENTMLSDEYHDPKSSYNYLINYPQPTVGTNAWDSNTKSHIAVIDNGKVKVTDTVTINNLAVGNTYIVRGIAVDVTNPDSPVFMKDSTGNYITAYTEFTLDPTSMLADSTIESIDIDINFEFSGNEELFANKTVNFYEYLGLETVGNNSIYAYKDYVDGTVTSANKLLTVTNNTLNLSNIGLIRNTNKTDYIKHANPKDMNQNVYFVSINTTESDAYNNTHYSGQHIYEAAIVDKQGNLSYETKYDYINVNDAMVIHNILSGRYQVKYKVKNYENDTVLSSGVEIVNVTSNKIDANGDYKLTINMPIAGVPASINKFYITEELYNESGTIKLASHTAKIDSQTGYISRISTNAHAPNTTDKLILSGSTATVVDTVSYTNLDTTKGYRLVGYLVDKSNDKIVATGNRSLTSLTTANGTADVTFTFNSTGLDGHTFVVYEYLFFGSENATILGQNVGTTFDADTMIFSNDTLNNRMVARHVDKGDANQTVYIPKMSTQIQGSQTVLPKQSVTITDEVTYENVLANKEYTMYGFFVDLGDDLTSEADDTVVATARKVFTATKSNDKAYMDFTFNSTQFVGHTIVAFEYMYNGNVTMTGAPTVGSAFKASTIPNVIGTNRLVGKHADSTDQKQTIIVTGIYVDVAKVNSRGELLDGAVFQLVNLDTGAEIAKWTSDNVAESVLLSGAGKYSIREIEAPSDHALAEPINFTVIIENGTMSIVNTESNTPYDKYVAADGTTHYRINYSDPELTRLPNAGGFGTVPFVGAGLSMLAITVYLLKKRREDTEA